MSRSSRAVVLQLCGSSGKHPWEFTPRWNGLEREFAELGVAYFPYTNSTSRTRLRDTLVALHGDQG